MRRVLGQLSTFPLTVYIHRLINEFGNLPGRDFVWQVGKSITSETYFISLITTLRVRYDTILKAGMQHKAFSLLTTSQKPHLLEGVFLEVWFCLIYNVWMHVPTLKMFFFSSVLPFWMFWLKLGKAKSGSQNTWT